jgi:hypothetical protein
MNTNLVHKITKSTDLAPLRELTSGVIGETCWRASLSYGDELTLHIGARIPYSQKSMFGQEKGAWILGTRGTAWRLDSPTEILAGSKDDPEILRQKIQAIENTKITVLETSYPELALTVIFNNKFKLMLFPKAEEDSDLPFWEMFTPSQRVLKVGPDARFRLLAISSEL